jgi:DNA mismatch repair ATPase MutS
VDSEFDAAKRDIANIEMALDNYLVEMKRKTGLNDIKYWGNNKDRYQIEVDITKTSRVPSEWTAKSQKKTHRRYRTSFIEDKLLELVDAENRVEAAQKDTLRKIFEKFDENRKIWNDAVQCIATIDALLSIATVSASPNYTWAEMIPNDSKSLPILNIQEGRHPMLEAVFSQR